ncbi:MAG: hypothetical protein QXH21_08205 [Ignisphaera sp.]
MNPEPQFAHKPNPIYEAIYEGTLVWDWSRGEVINIVTGEVVDRIYVEISMREQDDRLVPDIEIVTPVDELHPLHLTWTYYTLLEEIVDTYAKLKQMYSIECPIYLFEATVRKYLKKIENIRNGNTRGLRRKEFIAAFIYVALEENNVWMDLYKLSKALEIHHANLRSAILYVKNCLGKNVSSFAEKTRNYITMYGKKLNINPKVVADALEMYDKIRFTAKFTPRTVALAMLYLSLVKMGEPVDPIASVANLTKIKRIIKHILQVGVDDKSQADVQR